jgi:hypothetical protein
MSSGGRTPVRNRRSRDSDTTSSSNRIRKANHPVRDSLEALPPPPLSVASHEVVSSDRDRTPTRRSRRREQLAEKLAHHLNTNMAHPPQTSQQETSPGSAHMTLASSTALLHLGGRSNLDRTTNVRVALRVRPLISRELVERTTTCVVDDEDNNEVVIGVAPKEKRFTYDYVIGPTATQHDLYTRCGINNLVDGCFHGYNATIFAYGQTGSGKTYTMGSFAAGGDIPVENLGILPRVASRLFYTIEEANKRHQAEAARFAEADASASPPEEVIYTVRMTFLEIHKEVVRDLLSPESASINVTVRDNGRGGIRVNGLRPVLLKSEEDLVRHVNRGCAIRTTGSTLMNEHSSRSHAMITIMLEQYTKGPLADGKRGGRALKKNYKCAKLHIVDLAGSERQKRTGAVGKRFQESVRINQGLLALSNVISALGDTKKNRRGNHRHVPYRDSKLTRLLQDSLGGNSQTLMIACVTPALNSIEETLCVLKYANRARNIKNKARVNVEPELPELFSAEETDSGSSTEEGEQSDEEIEEDVELDVIGDEELNEAVAASMIAEEAAKADLELNSLKDDLQRYKNDLVTSEARVSFLQDRVRDVEHELTKSNEKNEKVEMELKEAKRDLERDEIIFAEKMQQFSTLQKKALEYYQMNKVLRSKVAEMSAAKSAVAPADPMVIKDIEMGDEEVEMPSKLALQATKVDAVVQVSSDFMAVDAPKLPVRPTVVEMATNTSVESPPRVNLEDFDVIEDETNDTELDMFALPEHGDCMEIDGVANPDFINTLIKKQNDEEDDEVTIMLGDDSFAPQQRKRGEEENVPEPFSVHVATFDADESCYSISGQSNKENRDVETQEAWLEDMTDGLARKKQDKGKLREATAQLKVLHHQLDEARQLRQSMSKEAYGSDDEALETRVEALDVQVDLERASVANQTKRLESEATVDLSHVYKALDDLDEREARSLLRRCCARMASLKEERTQFVSKIEYNNIQLRTQAEQLSQLELSLHKRSIEYDRRLREQRHNYEERIRAMLVAKPVKLKRSMVKEIPHPNPFSPSRVLPR